MTLPSDIPASIAERAAILMDAHRNVRDDLEYTARIIMAVEAEQKVQGYGLNESQSKMLAFVEAFIDEHGYSPTYDQIGAGLGLSSKSAVHRGVHQLVARGAMRKIKGRNQSLAVVGR
ncbi:hypothetical protein VW35_02400 [Devosia soli]|uniref:LexA repressor DNA-binding domain-containing protein n=1 Tax=Devosia soli TaxID=361041 RepID=A0A0F5LFD3_9HYPH|nr:hypothetical protein [Devosia soli]KKB81038.1 hypothetical protein VW35_02400 [Devosia soli]